MNYDLFSPEIPLVSQILEESRPFEENDWVKGLFKLQELEFYLDECLGFHLGQLPGGGFKNLFQADYHFTIGGLVRLFERQDVMAGKTGCSGFTSSFPRLLALIDLGYEETSQYIDDLRCSSRVINTGSMIGYNRKGLATCFMTILTSQDGEIIDVFPGYPSIIP